MRRSAAPTLSALVVLLLVAHGVAFNQTQRERVAKQAPTSAAAALELDLCDRCSPELRPRCVCPGERSAITQAVVTRRHASLLPTGASGWVVQGGGGDAVPGQSTRYRGGHSGVGMRRAQALLSRQGVLPLSGVSDGAAAPRP